MKTINSDLFDRELKLATKHSQDVTKILMDNVNRTASPKKLIPERDSIKAFYSQCRITTS